MACLHEGNLAILLRRLQIDYRRCNLSMPVDVRFGRLS